MEILGKSSTFETLPDVHVSYVGVCARVYSLLLLPVCPYRNPQEILTPLCQVLSSKSCPFESLDLSDSKLKENMVPVLEALLSNRSLLELDIR